MGKDEHLARSAKGTGPREVSIGTPSGEDSPAELITHDDPSSTTVAETLDSVSSSVSRPLVKNPADFKGKRLGSYEIERLLGKGGVGLVYLAYDHRLTRRVALKLLRTDDPEATHRLLDEARAQARVEHENVCQVYEAGEIDGQTYIAMQHLEGQPLTRAFQSMTLEEKVRVIQRVAEGLEAAHAQNLIHRDIKPGNVLVEKTPRGEWKPFILDFGLAREQAAPGETTTGEVKGTPSYMPPEQVSGLVHTLDARADVYSLGATFYEGIAGRQLFPETSGGLAVMLKVLNEDPEPVRAADRTIPVDIESIIMHCLEKDPSRRYPSAQALADDLQRFLDGEPIVARPIGPLKRLWRKLRKRRVTALAIGLVVTVVVSVAMLVFSQVRTARKARFMDEYRQEVRFLDELIKHVYEAPLHDVTADKAKVRKRMAEIEAQLAVESRLAWGPGNYALGRGYQILHEYELAHHHLQVAWDNGARDPAVGYALGRALGALYEKELQVAGRIEEEGQREAHLREIEELYRRPALDYLRHSNAVEVDSVDSVEMVEALIALWEKRYDGALEKAMTAYEQVPWLYEALTVQGDVHVAVGQTRYKSGEYEAALAAYRRAQTVYASAAEKGRSDARIYEGQCSLSFAMMELDHALGGSVRGPFEYGLEACGRARRVDPERAESYELESMISWRKGDYDLEAGRDPTAYLTRATEAANEALEIAPDHVETYASLGWSQALLARWQIGRGLDPRPTAAEAVEAFRAGIGLDPHVAQCHHGLGYTRFRVAEWEIDHSVDASVNLNSAVESIERAVALEPNYAYALDNLGSTYVNRAMWEVLQDEDPSSSVEEAVRVFSSLRGLNAHHMWAHYGIGDAWSYLANHQLKQGRDPRESILKARAAFEMARQLDPREGWIPLSLGRLDLFEGRWEALRGKAPDDSFRRARQSYEEGLELMPGQSPAYQMLAELDRYWARWKLERGDAPASYVARGLRATASALEVDPGSAEARATEGSLLALEAESETDPRRRRQHVDAARTALEKALELNSNLSVKYQAVLERLRELS